MNLSVAELGLGILVSPNSPCMAMPERPAPFLLQRRAARESEDLYQRLIQELRSRA